MAQEMKQGICVLTSVSAKRKGDKTPRGWAIVIAPTKKMARNLATRELFPFLKLKSHDDKEVNKWNLDFQKLGHIVFPPVSTVVFLYTQDAGRIK